MFGRLAKRLASEHGYADDGLPATIGGVRRFAAHGNTFDVRKISGSEYSLGCSAETRRRYGRAIAIRRDMAVARRTGKLPPRIDHAF